MNIIDKYYEITNPEKALTRLKNREAIGRLREYTAARPSRLSGGYSRRNSRASDEVAKAHRPLAAGAQDLARNTALGCRIKAVIASNIVGTGIKPDYIGGGSKRKVERYKNRFMAWADSTACDYEGHNNLWGLEWLWAGTIVECGGVFVRRIMNNALAFPLVLQTLEQQYLDEAKSGKTENGEIVSGIEYNDDGIIRGYWLKTRLVGNHYREESRFFSADDIYHFYRKERPGQHLGASWLHPVADLVNARQEHRDAALDQQKLAACFGILITEPTTEMGLGSSQRGVTDSDGVEYTEVEPGMIGYIGRDTTVTNVTPPKLTGASDFMDRVDQDISVGVGITKEQLTGDFSKVTWASGRLARGELYTNLDRWQLFMMLPGLNRIHDWFDDIYTVKYGAMNDIKRNWILPHRSAVNPKEELEVDIMKVRSCAMTPQQFSAKHGVKFEDVVQGWVQAKEIFGDMPFDHDPSRFSAAGNQIDANGAEVVKAPTSKKPAKDEKA